MTAVVASALLFAWVGEQGSFAYALIVAVHSLAFWTVVLAGSFSLARAFGPTVRSRAAGRWSWSLAVTSMIGTAYLAWGMYRTTYQLEWLGRGFPYPDPAIIALEHWFDARHPIRTPGSLKLHGEFPRVEFAIGLAIVALLAVDGLLLGLLAIPPDRGRSPVARRVPDRP